jgi:hypothetical protein
MIQVAEEFVEAVHRGQITVQIAEMILPELSRGVAERLERLGDGNVAVLQADRRAWDADFGEAGTQSALPGNEGRAAGSATLLGVIIGEHHAFLGNAIDVRGAVAHQPHRISAHIGEADIVAEDDEYIGLRSIRWWRGGDPAPVLMPVRPLPFLRGPPQRQWPCRSAEDRDVRSQFENDGLSAFDEISPCS